MLLKFVIVTLVLCELVIQIKSDENNRGLPCKGQGTAISEYRRIKRSKYFSNPPQRFYRKPPTTYPIKGPFSYTPPPSYMIDDDEAQFPTNLRPFKVSKRPNYEGLGDEDLNNLMKYLSKQDLDKIVEFAAEKEGKVDKYRGPTFEKYPGEIGIPPKSVNKNSFKINAQETDSDQGSPTNDVNLGNNPYSIEYSNSPQEVQDSSKPKIIYISNLRDIPGSSQSYTNIPLDTQESVQNSQFSYIQTSIDNEVNAMVSSTQLPYVDGVLFTDSKTMKEEELPKPLNLRENYEISYTNNVPTVVTPDSSYKVENFGNLPLMNFDSKLDTVSSYYVPHYSVTSPVKSSASLTAASASSLGSSYSAQSSAIQAPYPASSASVAQKQSDSRLKTIKIWTHRSKGTAYTLHNDGTLSLERPLRPNMKYGYP